MRSEEDADTQQVEEFQPDIEARHVREGTDQDQQRDRSVFEKPPRGRLLSMRVVAIKCRRRTELWLRGNLQRRARGPRRSPAGWPRRPRDSRTRKRARCGRESKS